MLQTIAIDDEPIALEVIKTHASTINFIEMRAIFTHVSKAMEYLQKNEIDLIFLDIKMPGISGIDFFKSLPNPMMAIFTTAYSKHAVQSFELDAIDYLLKPFSKARFLKACEKANELYELRKTFQHSLAGQPSIFVKSGYERVRILLEEICYVEASGNYVQFVLKNRKILSRLSVNEVEELLPRAAFIRTHRSYIVAVKRITKVEKDTVWIDQKAFPVSNTFSNALQRIHSK